MPTMITLASQSSDGKPMKLRVSQSPEEVRQAWKDSTGDPFALTSERDVAEVWVNPGAVITWREPRTSGAGAAGAAAGAEGDD